MTSLILFHYNQEKMNGQALLTKGKMKNGTEKSFRWSKKFSPMA